MSATGSSRRHPSGDAETSERRKGAHSAARPGVAGAAGLGSRIECLSCGPGGELSRVAAVYRDGRDVVQIRGRAFGPDGSSVVPMRARATRISRLARVLAPPRRPSVAVPIVLLGASVFFLMVVSATALSADGGSAALPAAVLPLAVGAASGSIVWARRRGPSVTGRGVGRARWLWERCWYCRRCGFVSLVVPGVVAQLLPADGLAASLCEVAGRIRWRPTSGGSFAVAVPGCGLR